MGLKEDKNFELLLREENHKELIMKLDAILKALNSKEESASLDLSGIEAAIAQMKQPANNKEIPNAILALSDVIVSKISEINQEKKEWTFKVERDADGFIDVVKATSD